MGVVTHDTFLDVHSRFVRTSCASRTPSAKRARDLARRACALACSSKSSRCLALRVPELFGLSLALFSITFFHHLVANGEELTPVPALPSFGPTAEG